MILTSNHDLQLLTYLMQLSTKKVILWHFMALFGHFYQFFPSIMTPCITISTPCIGFVLYKNITTLKKVRYCLFVLVGLETMIYGHFEPFKAIFFGINGHFEGGQTGK